MSGSRLIDQTSAEWLTVVSIVKTRMEDLAEQILSPLPGDQARHDLVQRRDELQQLLLAPAEMRDRIVREASDPPLSTY